MSDASDYVLGPYFLLLLKFGAVLSMNYGYEWLFDGGFMLEA